VKAAVAGQLEPHAAVHVTREVAAELERPRSRCAARGCATRRWGGAGAVRSTAATLDEAVAEIAATRITKRRQTRADDRARQVATEDRKREGYFSMATEATRIALSAPAGAGGPQLLRFATAGSVDDGKSTLIGRLLYDSKALMADQVADAEHDLARVTDGLRAEREQGITIDVAYRHFSTPRRRFVIADTPGHAQYTRNMVTGASTDVAVVLVDAREGLLTQSRRHAAIAGLLRIPRIVLAVNKMDRVDYDQDAFRRVCADFRAWASRLDVNEVTCLPISALRGDNVVERSAAMDWHRGPTLLEYLETVPVASGGAAAGPLRLPVQLAIRSGDRRAYAGQLAAGVVRPGDELLVMPSGLTTRVTAVEGPGGPLESAGAPLSVAVSLEDELDVGRGSMLCAPDVPPRTARDVAATVCWMGESPARPGGRYLLKHTTRMEQARLEVVHDTLDVSTLQPNPAADSLGLNDIGRVSIRCASALSFDPYADNRATGAFILIDEATNDTVGAGLLADPLQHGP
jgi:bifunctional enzyme CysN/CysC